MSHILITLAGLMGASGVILGAVGAHVAPGTGLDSAAYTLLFHAAAILGATAVLHQGLLWRPPVAIALVAWVLGAVLFSGTSPCGRLLANGCSRWPRRAAASCS